MKTLPQAETQSNFKMLGPPSRLESTKMLREVLEITNQKLIDSDHWEIGIQRGAVLCREFRTEKKTITKTLVCNSDLFIVTLFFVAAYIYYKY